MRNGTTIGGGLESISRKGETDMKGLWGILRFLPGFMSLLVLGRAGGKQENTDSNLEVNHPTFTGRKDFISSFVRVRKIRTSGTLDGKPVLQPGKDNSGWPDPAFREKLCLVVTINNHCVG
jgi:hypothetical protein